MPPVVEARAAKRFLVGTKSQRPNQPQFGARGQARPPHVAGVGGNLGLAQDDVQLRLVTHKAERTEEARRVKRAERFYAALCTALESAGDDTREVAVRRGANGE